MIRSLFIAVDIEGISGVASPDQLGPGQFEWQKARDWMTAEAAAAARAGLDAGFDEVIVADGHGNAQNILPDGMPDRTRLVRGWPRPLLQMDGVEEESVAACMMIGFHGAARGPRGVLAHTYHGGLFVELRLNGIACSEAYLNAALAGECGVPTLLVTGDDAVCSEMQAFAPYIDTCAVKRAISWKSVSGLSPQEGAARVGAAATAALARRGDIPPFRVAGPYELDIVFTNRVSAELLGLLPCFSVLDPFTARFSAPTMRAVMQAISFAIFYPRAVL